MHASNPDLLINLQDYDIDQLLCQKCFIADFLAKDRKHGREVVIKNFYNFHNSDDRPTKKEFFIRMLCCFLECDIPGIVKILGIRFPLTEDERRYQPIQFQSPKGGVKTFDFSGYILVSEYMPNGNLEDITKDYIKNHGVSQLLNPTVRSKIIFGVAATMKSVHAANLFHGDLRLENIYLDENVEPRIADFKLSHYFKFDYRNFGPESTILNPLLYYAPELFADGTFTFGADVYAFASLIYQMFTDELGFDSLPKIRNLHQFMMNISRGNRPKRSDAIPEKYWELIEQCWEVDPLDRPSFKEITQLLRSDDYAIEEFGQKTDLNALHEYWDRIDPLDNQDVENS